ncbi:hypothetical protein [Acetonema longum]|uniref:Uncharacterized protein n=1 Tax=Acetonema longum DSM 6540 TaxID=1009370 RepID=F7NKJ6_9FIRM|nr:hypothetical protein [Acetonema longum]EGO63448.1 hypothetical protein ALO_13050 [Acetonema longum DSM 6540]
MSRVIAGKLLAGVIFGDGNTKEYIYLPAGEVGSSAPICIMESRDKQRDLVLEEAVAQVLRLSLKPARHPLLGNRSF